MIELSQIFKRLVVVVLLACDLTAWANDGPHSDVDSRGRSTAVTLNYCRASFHRIRRYQSKRVLIEEQEKILNNLNLNGIGDEEVIKLYSAVLDEISKVQIADREVQVMNDKFRKGVHRQVSASAIALGTQMALGSLDNAVRTGVNSWLDYRDLTLCREFDIWKIEKDRMQAVVDKSTSFLDTFWKLGQKKNIPDRWLVRGDDLDSLEEAVREIDPEKRMRILRRMEPFMECYPPYWYFLARATQARGDFESAIATYDRATDLAHGHFRKDDMLAAALANKAIIQEHRQIAGADKTAQDALSYSAAVWEANLLCAQVLERHGHLREAEDAILRNLDVDLEKSNSTLALVGLYYRADRKTGLEQLLATDSLVTYVPVQTLMLCLDKVSSDRVPAGVAKKLRESMLVTIEARFGLDDVVVSCDGTWLPQFSKVRISVPNADGSVQWLDANSVAVVESRPRVLEVSLGAQPSSSEKNVSPPLATTEFVIRFKSAIEAGNPLTASAAALFGATLVFMPNQPSDAAPITVTLGNAVNRRGGKSSVWGSAAAPAEISTGRVTASVSPENTPILIRGMSRSQDSGPVTNPTDGPGKDRDRKLPRARILDVVPIVDVEAAKPKTVNQTERITGDEKSTTSDNVPPPPPEPANSASES